MLLREIFSDLFRLNVTRMYCTALLDKESGANRLHRALFKRNGGDLLSIPVSKDSYASVRIKLYLRKIFEVVSHRHYLVA